MNGEQYDIVVIGCGIAELSAGLRAAEKGESIALLEKSSRDHRSEHARFRESFRIPTADINLDAEFNVDDYSASDFYSDVMQVTNYRADPDLPDVVTTRSVECVE